MTTKDLLKVFQLEKPKPNQIVRIMWVEEDENKVHVGSTLRTPEEAERLLKEILSKAYYRYYYNNGEGRIEWWNIKFEDCKPTTNLRNSYIVEA